MKRLPRLQRPMCLTREQGIWLAIRLVGINVLVFGVLIQFTAVLEYCTRLAGIGVANTSSAVVRDYAFWATMRLGVGGLSAAYLLRGGQALYRLLDRLVPTLSDERAAMDDVTPYGPPCVEGIDVAPGQHTDQS